MSNLDWAIILAVMTSALVVSVYGKRLVQGVSGYMVAERSAGRYLLVISNGMAGMGAITIVAQFEMFYDAGLTANWWMLLSVPATLIITLSGWVYYRFRRTRAMTIGEFLGKRYSQRLRVFAGVLAFLSGVLNFGIFPAVGSRFVMTLADLPETLPIAGGIPLQPVLMLVMVAAATAIVLSGGQIAIILTDLLFGAVTLLSMLFVVLYLWTWINWQELVAILERDPVGQSRLDPFSSVGLEGFNIWFFVISVLFSFYATLSFQGDTPYRATPLSPHESRMAALLIEWRAIAIRLMLILMPLAAILLLEGTQHPELQSVVQAKIAALESPTVARQMTVPTVAAAILPTGLKGAFVVLVLGAFLSTHDTYLHSWASVLVRDVIQPMWRRPISEVGQLRLLRAAVVVVAIMILTISLTIEPRDYLLKFMMLSASVFIGGAGAVLVGGLYTNWGSSWGAWLSLGVGCCLAMAGLTGQVLWEGTLYPWLKAEQSGALQTMEVALGQMASWLPGVEFVVERERFPVDGQWLSLLTMLCSIAAYVAGSLAQRVIQGRPVVSVQHLFIDGPGDAQTGRSSLVQMFYSLFPSGEHTRADRVIWAAKVMWTGALCLVFVLGTLASYWWEVPSSWWSVFWRLYLLITLAIAVVVSLWFGIGAIFDIRAFLSRLQPSVSCSPSDIGMPQASGDRSS